MSILREWNLSIDEDMVLRGQGADPSAVRRRRPALVAYAQEAIAEAMPLLEPAVAYRVLAVEGLQHERLLLAGGGRLTGPLVAEHLGGAERVVAMLCTVGRRLEEHAVDVSAQDPLRGLALDGVGSAAAEALATAACRHFEAQAASEGLYPTLPLNPGMLGWPVEQGQSELFALLDGAPAGITLTSSQMMIPRKSVSLVLGLRPERSPSARPCDYCHLRESCRYQAA